jgi:hypothetical protein
MNVQLNVPLTYEELKLMFPGRNLEEDGACDEPMAQYLVTDNNEIKTYRLGLNSVCKIATAMLYTEKERVVNMIKTFNEIRDNNFVEESEEETSDEDTSDEDSDEETDAEEKSDIDEEKTIEISDMESNESIDGNSDVSTDDEDSYEIGPNGTRLSADFLMNWRRPQDTIYRAMEEIFGDELKNYNMSGSNGKMKLPEKIVEDILEWARRSKLPRSELHKIIRRKMDQSRQKNRRNKIKDMIIN